MNIKDAYGVRGDDGVEASSDDGPTTGEDPVALCVREADEGSEEDKLREGFQGHRVRSGRCVFEKRGEPGGREETCGVFYM